MEILLEKRNHIKDVSRYHIWITCIAVSVQSNDKGSRSGALEICVNGNCQPQPWDRMRCLYEWQTAMWRKMLVSKALFFHPRETKENDFGHGVIWKFANDVVESVPFSHRVDDDRNTNGRVLLPI